MTTTTLARGVANATVVAGIVHIGIGTVRHRDELARWARRGGWNSVQPDDPAAQGTLWFLAAGAALVLQGMLGRDAVRRTGRFPRAYGVGTLMSAATIAALQPKSGAWGLLVLGGLALGATEASR